LTLTQQTIGVRHDGHVAVSDALSAVHVAVADTRYPAGRGRAGGPGGGLPAGGRGIRELKGGLLGDRKEGVGVRGFKRQVLAARRLAHQASISDQ
jgi:hypothetical protein